MTKTNPYYPILIFKSLILLILFNYAIDCSAQIQLKNVNTMALNVDDGLAMSRVDDVICDQQNIIWIKTNRGLQYWDGQQIYSFEDSILNVGTNFHMYTHPNEGIYISVPGLLRQFTFEGQKKTITYESEKADFIPISLVSSTTNCILIHQDSVYHYTSEGEGTISFIQKEAYSDQSNIFKYTIEGSNFLVDFSFHKYTVIDSTISKSTINAIPVRLRNTVLFDSNNAIISGKIGLIIIKGDSEIIVPYPNGKYSNYYSTLIKVDEDRLLVGVDNELYEYNLRQKKWTAIYKDLDQKNLIQTGYYDKLIFDKYKNIWAVTVNEGLLKIYSNDTFKYFGTENKDLNFVKNIVADEESNRIIYAAMNGGIMVFDTSGNLLNQLNDQNTNGLVKSVTGIYKTSENQYIFNNHRDSIIYGLSFLGEKFKIKPLGQKKESYVYYQDAIRNDSISSFLLFNTLYKLNHSPFGLTPLFLYVSTKPCMIKDGNELWIGCIDGLLRYRIDNDSEPEFISLPGEGYIRSISKWKNGKFAIGSDKGLSIFDKDNSSLKLINEGCVYCLLSDDNHNIWAGTGNGILNINKDFKKSIYSIVDGLPNNEFNTNACVKSPSGHMYFGGLNGITSFDPLSVYDKNQGTSLYIKELKANNTNLLTNANVAHLSNLKLDHDQNNISIDVGAIGKFESNQYNYQYFVEGLSSEWIDAGTQTQYNFNLTSGKYRFYFLASNAFDSDAELENPFKVTIKHPWWKQWWFYLLTLIVAFGIIYYFIRAKEKQKYLKKKFEWELESQRQEDRMNMSKELHDNIGSRLTFLVSSIENIKNAFQSDQKQAAINKIDNLTDFGKDTIEDLRSMMWVLTQKSITIQDLQLKILDYLNIAKNTYRNIDFQYIGLESRLDQQLDSKLSQNIFRVIQESIHNSIKHANPSIIKITTTWSNDKLNIKIEDNGNGFNKNKISSGNGLRNIKLRLAEHDSELIITSAIGNGTILSFEIELNQTR